MNRYQEALMALGAWHEHNPGEYICTTGTWNIMVATDTNMTLVAAIECVEEFRIRIVGIARIPTQNIVAWVMALHHITRSK